MVPVDSVVLVEAPVLDGNHGVLKILGDILVFDPDAVVARFEGNKLLILAGGRVLIIYGARQIELHILKGYLVIGIVHEIRSRVGNEDERENSAGENEDQNERTDGAQEKQQYAPDAGKARLCGLFKYSFGFSLQFICTSL